MSRYCVFCPDREIEKLPSGVKLEERYPAFSIVSASEDVIKKIRKHYPVKRMKEPKAPPEPEIAGGSISLAEGQKQGPYFRVVKFLAPVRQQWIQELERIGCQHHGAIGSSTFVISCPDKASLRKLEELSTIYYRSTTYKPYIQVSSEFFEVLGVDLNSSSESKQKGYKADQQLAGLGSQASAGKRLSKGSPPPPPMQPNFRTVKEHNLPLPGILIASFFIRKDQQQAKRQFMEQGIQEIKEINETDLLINLCSCEDIIGAVRMIVAQQGLRSLVERRISEVCNDRARPLIAGQAVLPKPSDLGLTGRGEIVAVADTGLDTGETENLHPDFGDRVINIRAFPVSNRFNLSDMIVDPNGDDKADRTGHGTHVAGSILGSGACSGELGLKTSLAGMAPEARLVFQALEHTLQLRQPDNAANETEVSYGLVGIPNDIKRLFEAAYAQGARIHTIAWGTKVAGAIYDDDSRNLDQFVWNNKDYLIVVAAGNEGRDQGQTGNPPADGTIKPRSLTSPATAKNCLTIGACENNRPDQFQDRRYGEKADKWPVEPFSIDPITDCYNDIAALSSRGPCADGRRKPDVVAPGTMVLSIRSSKLDGEKNRFGPLTADGLGRFPDAENDYIYINGTSMSAALVAGYAALLRQYLREEKMINNPSAALLKALIIHSAQYSSYRYAADKKAQCADNEQGWGRVNLEKLLESDFLFKDVPEGIPQHEAYEALIEVTDPSLLRITMVYTDRPNPRGDEGGGLVNNLNLFAFDPKGQAYVGNEFAGSSEPDDLNNVESIFVDEPKPGMWTIRVVASSVPEDASQDFALVISGAGVKWVPTLGLYFEGWFQCRLATYPDKYDEKRGKAGWTFAFEGEPDFDRIIRLQPDSVENFVERSHCPPIGVRVTKVILDEAPIVNHPFLNAQVDLLDKPVFEGRDGDIAPSGLEPIMPFRLKIKTKINGETVILQREDNLALENKDDLKRRQAQSLREFSKEVAQATGINLYLQYREERRKKLLQDLETDRDNTALTRRINELGNSKGRRETSLGFQQTYKFDLRNEAQTPNEYTDVLGGTFSAAKPWPIRFWMGAWDADALSGYIKGSVEIPFVPAKHECFIPQESLKFISLKEPLDLNNPDAQKFLEDLQGNILKSHGRRYAAHLILRFNSENVAVVRTWIADFAKNNVTSAQKQREATDEWKKRRQSGDTTEGELFAMFLLSAAGYRALEFKDSDIPVDPAGSFLRGMKRPRKWLNDPTPSLWDKPYNDEIHSIIILAHENYEHLQVEVEAVQNELRAFCEVVHLEEGERKFDEGRSIEPFGFTDGISQPRLIKQDIEEEIEERGNLNWDPAASLDLVLVEEPGDNNSYGSFMVFRKLEQNVKGFKEAIKELAGKLGVDEQEAGALAVGRYKNGAPLIPTKVNKTETLSNDFNFMDDREGKVCPFQAHIRRTNPRGDLDTFQVRIGTTELSRLAFERSKRIVRHGIPYDHRTDQSEENPEIGVGLLFMCFQSSLDQFEIQQNAAHSENFPREQKYDGVDAIIGRSIDPNHPLKQSWGEIKFAMTDFVKLKGGEYFFAPSLPFLKKLTETK
jgi:serine protease AprX